MLYKKFICHIIAESKNANLPINEVSQICRTFGKQYKHRFAIESIDSLNELVARFSAESGKSETGWALRQIIHSFLLKESLADFTRREDAKDVQKRKEKIFWFVFILSIYFLVVFFGS
ncbi:MAG: hypothetical protein PHE67_00175 [Campylobacterales bacterium]|nr:hypothetical protein [Campylobacterales bacterium]